MSLSNFTVAGSLNFVGFGYVDTPLSAAEELAEEVAARDLPAIEGLDSCVTSAERVAVLCLKTAQLRDAFVALHGNAFGFDNDALVPGQNTPHFQQWAVAAL